MSIETVIKEIGGILEKMSKVVESFNFELYKVTATTKVYPYYQIVLSLRKFCEADTLPWTFNVLPELGEKFGLPSLEVPSEFKEKVREVCGYYDRNNYHMIISLPCILDKPDPSSHFIKTLAHLLIHHCQYKGGLICEVKYRHQPIPVMLFEEMVHEALPYPLRPDEVEAFSREEYVAEMIEDIIGKENVNKMLNSVAELLKEITEIIHHEKESILTHMLG